MNNFDKTPYKLQKLDSEIILNQNNYNALKKISPKIGSISYTKNKTIYTVDSYTITSLFDYANTKSYSLVLNNFPENILPYIKVLPIISTKTLYNDLLSTIDEYPHAPPRSGWQNQIYWNFVAQEIEGTDKMAYTMNITISLYAGIPSEAQIQFNTDVEIKIFLSIPKEYNSVEV